MKARTVAIIQGTTYGGSIWCLKTNTSITVDTTAQVWGVQQPSSVEIGTPNPPPQLDTTTPLTNGRGWSYNSTTGKMEPGLSVLASVTKRVTAPITGGATDFMQRIPIKLPVTTTRWRIRAANYSAYTESPGAGPVTGTGVWLGTPNVVKPARRAGHAA